jgi:tRNA(Ile)-lysidine synthase
MTGRKKIKDLFIDNKVALSVRARLPLLILGQEVIWVPGYGRSTIARVSADTKSILRLKLVTLGT